MNLLFISWVIAALSLGLTVGILIGYGRLSEWYKKHTGKDLFEEVKIAKAKKKQSSQNKRE